MEDNTEAPEIAPISESVDLDYPFVFIKKRVESIDIPRPRAFHIRGLNFKKIEGGDADELLKLIQKLTGESPKYIDQIDMVDIQRIGDVIESFLDNGQKTGKTSSPS